MPTCSPPPRYGSFWGCLLLGGLLCAPAVSQEADKRPGDVLDLSGWRLTLPLDTPRPLRPDEVRPPELSSFVKPPYFLVNEDGTGVVFRAHCGGVATRGSRFPRCELREVRSDGERAWWSTTDSRQHTLTMTAAITATPQHKQHVVCAQIHDDEDDLLMIRLEGTKLFVERNDVERVMQTRRYQRGTPFHLKIQAGHGRVRLWYDHQLSMDWSVRRDQCYFKAGCYTQSNPDRGDQPDSFGEVVISELSVSSAP